MWVGSLGAAAGDQQVAARCGGLDKYARCYARGWAGSRGWCGACGAAACTPQARLLKLASGGRLRSACRTPDRDHAIPMSFPSASGRRTAENRSAYP